MFWIGSSQSRWTVVAQGEKAFDRSLARLFELPEGASTDPWACAPTASGLLARACLRSGKVNFTEHSLWPGASNENCHSASRRSNSIRFFEVAPNQVQQAAQALLSRLPEAWVFASQGLAAEPQALSSQQGPKLPLLEPYFESGATPPRPEMQVDGAGEAFWLWLPAAARALGAPAQASISLRGLGDFLALGDVLGAANRLASADPAKFRERFSQAIAPSSPPPGGLANCISPARETELHFLNNDRFCVEVEQLRNQTPAAPSRAAPRL